VARDEGFLLWGGPASDLFEKVVDELVATQRRLAHQLLDTTTIVTVVRR
jgi:hypothetical protein